ncbi:MAG: TrkH family potassium uptake protein [Archaeoglobaceae archaeon]
MNCRYVLNSIGQILIVFSVSFAFPLSFAYFSSEKIEVFLIPLLLSLSLGVILVVTLKERFEELISDREVYTVVAILWLIIPGFGSLPFILSGINPLDAFFEAFSGFTTTGATVFVPEELTNSLLLWRSMMQWIGGLGIVVIFLIFLPQMRKSSALFQAEYPAVLLPKIKPKMREIAVSIFQLYLFLTLAEIIVLYMLGINLFDAVAHSFSTISTGGFSTHSESIYYFKDVRVEAAVAFFAFMGGVNFGLIYALRSKQLRVIADLEFRYYIGFIAISAILLTFLNLSHYSYLESARFSAFQAISVVSNTGFTTADFDSWSDGCKMIILTLILIGGCSGSTAGGMKVIRVVILLKYVAHQIARMVEPKAIKVIRYGDYVVSKELVEEVVAFFILYIFIFFVSSLLLSLLGYDMQTSLSVSASTISNFGPAFGLGGATENLANFSPIAKIVLIFNMWFGRLEILPVFNFLFSALRRESW